MKLGVHREQLAPSLAEADRAWLYRPNDLGWDLGPVADAIGPRAAIATDVAELASRLAADSRQGDHVLIMSNGGFGGLHGRLLEALKARTAR
jgi:UDP-N-acetylmuramate: L-alanyl-gamma-D-glutamyl-meso-diaminopimelate ligase